MLIFPSSWTTFSGEKKERGVIVDQRKTPGKNSTTFNLIRDSQRDNREKTS